MKPQRNREPTGHDNSFAGWERGNYANQDEQQGIYFQMTMPEMSEKRSRSIYERVMDNLGHRPLDYFR